MDNEDLITTQELPVVDGENLFKDNPEKQIEKAQLMIDRMLHALGGKRMYRNHYVTPFDSKSASDWWFLVGMGLAKIYNNEGSNLTFEVTCQGVAYLKSIGAFAKKGT